MRKFGLLSVDCLDSFSGYHLPYICIPLFSQVMTNEETAQEIRNEFNSCLDMFDDCPWFEGLMEQFISKLLENPKETYIDLTDSSFEIYEDLEMYAFFSVYEKKYSNGLMFLS
jgi:hypothetical protein